MAKRKTEDIRNIVLCGHSGSGKTMLSEAMLHKAGATNRLGKVDDGSTVSDYDPDEKDRQYSLNASVMHCEHNGKHFNIIDTPGSVDFIGGMVSGVAGADLAVICINAATGVELLARKAWEQAGALGLGRMIAICRMDGDNVNYQETLEAAQQAFGKNCIPFTIPDGEGSSLKGVTAVLADDASGEGVDDLKLQITESAVECDEEMTMRYLEGEEISRDEVMGVMSKAITAGNIVPVFCLASEKDMGVEELMNGIANWGTTPLDITRKAMKGEEETEVTPAVDGPFYAQVFKVISDPHVGKLSYFRVFSGSVESKTSAEVSSTENQVKLAQLMLGQGEKREDISEAVCGDIAIVAKVDDLNVGDTLRDKGSDVAIVPPVYPNPMTGLAVSPKSRGDEQKLGQNMHRLCDEDPTFIFERNELTAEQVVRGMGQLHLDVMLHRLKARYGIEVDTKPPKIPYLETVSAEAEGSYRHKKQSGGAGQFAEVHLRIKPNERGAGFEFVNAIVGGVISGPFIPSVEKGVKRAMAQGPVAGYPMVDVIAELFFGKEHPVDSKDIAFQIAGEVGFKDIVKKCKPVLLEPLVDIEIVFPAQYTGDISGDISGRRGRPTGMEQLGAMQVLKAQVPLAEVADYGSVLSGITQGEGFYSMELSHYEPVPSNIAQQVAAKAKAEAEEDH